MDMGQSEGNELVKLSEFWNWGRDSLCTSGTSQLVGPKKL